MTTISDLQAVRAWWRTLGSPDDDAGVPPASSSPAPDAAGTAFLALPLPTRARYTQADGHDDAAELIAERGLAPDTSYVFWHWQRHEVFDEEGMLTAPLILHWGGDHAVVRAELGDGPDGFEIRDGGPASGFALDRATRRDADGLPDAEDAAGVRRFLDELGEPLDRRRWHVEHRPFTAAEEAWLLERIAEGLSAALEDPAAIDDARLTGPLDVLSLRDAVPLDDARALLGPWRVRYGEDLGEWPAWAAVLRTLVRAEDPEGAVLARELGGRAADVLADVDRPAVLPILRELVAGGADAGAWLEAVSRVEGIDAPEALRRVGAEILLEESGLPDTPRTWDQLGRALLRLEVTGDGAPEDGATARAELAWALDDSLPRPFRSRAARRVRVLRGALEASAPDDASLGAGAGADLGERVKEELQRFDALVDDLLAGTGPDLTAYYGSLVEVWHRYRVLDGPTTAWLHEQVADPATEIQGLAFCLELLVSHGEGTSADVDALRRRWRKELAKSYETTYVPWRHPMVSLTCLAAELGDPLAETLDRWWERTPPKWKGPSALLTLLGAPDEEGRRRLEEFVASGEHDTGQLATLVLLSARLDGRRPVDVVDTMLADGRLHGLQAVDLAIAVADPSQPLWRYHGASDGWGGWQRLVLLVDEPDLSPALREQVLRRAETHRAIAQTGTLRDVAATDLDAARAWFAERTSSPSPDRDAAP